MIPRTPIILGILCIVFAVVSIIGINSSEKFSEYMDLTPLQYKLKEDSKILSEINQLGLEYQENSEEKNSTNRCY